MIVHKKYCVTIYFLTYESGCWMMVNLSQVVAMINKCSVKLNTMCTNFILRIKSISILSQVITTSNK